MGETDRAKAEPQSPWALPPGTRVWSGGHHEAAKKLLLAHLREVTRPHHGLIDVGFLAPASVDEAAYFAGKIIPRLKQPATVWIIYPAADSKQVAGFDGSAAAIGEALSEHGLSLRATVPVGDNFLAAQFQADRS